MGDVCNSSDTKNEGPNFDSAFAEAEQLKKSCAVQSLADVSMTSAKWEVRQQLQDRYRAMLLDNLELSIKRGVELDMWRYTCYNIISVMQAHLSKGVGGMYRAFLNSSTGFFSQLLRELCDVHHRRITAMPRSRYLGWVILPGIVVSECSRAFYIQAIQVKPLNGQPYNQLAILSSNEKSAVETLYLHVRSVALSFPFPAGQANLSNWLLKCISDTKTGRQDTLQSNFLYIVFRVLNEREPMTLPDLCADFLEAVKSRIEVVSPPCTELFVKLCTILMYVYNQCAGKGNEYSRAVYGLLFEFMSVLVSVMEETPSTAPKLLPTLTLLSHWVPLVYQRDIDELVPVGLWSDLNSYVRAQPREGEEWEARAVAEEEELRAFEPLRMVLNHLGARDKNAGSGVRVCRLRKLLHWAAMKGIVSTEQELVMSATKSLTLDTSTQFGNPNLPISPMYLPYQMVPGGPIPAPYPMNPERQPPPPSFRMNPDSPFVAPEPRRASFMRQFPSVMYHEAVGLQGVPHDTPQEQPDYQNFLPPSYVHSKFMSNGNKFMEEQPRMMALPDQRNMYRPNPPPHPVFSPAMQLPTGARNTQPAASHFARNFPVTAAGEQFPNLMDNGVPKPVKGKDEDLFVSSASPFSLGATPWTSTSGPIARDLDIWPLTAEDHDLSSLHQLLNGKK
eukprot:sb/3462726/